MLIYRKIQNAQKKLDLLNSFINKYDIDLNIHKYLAHIISLTSYFISEPDLCNELKITKHTLRNWRNREGSLIFSTKDLPTFISIKKPLDQLKEGDPTSVEFYIKRCRHYNIASVQAFLVDEVNLKP